jgi:hypothetical protein
MVTSIQSAQYDAHLCGLSGILHQATDAKRSALYEAIGVSAVYNPEQNQVRLGADPLLQQRVGGGTCGLKQLSRSHDSSAVGVTSVESVARLRKQNRWSSADHGGQFPQVREIRG